MDSWESDRIHLNKELGVDITKRAIRRISVGHNGKVLVAEVGKPNPYNGIVVRAIYEDSSRGIFLICAGTVTIAGKDSLVEDA